MNNTFYGGNNGHPEAGEVVAVSVDGQLYINPANADYLKSQSPKSLNKVKSDTVNHTGFSKSRVINDDEKSEPEQQLDRLAILQNTEARLVKELEGIRKVIKIVKESI